MTQRRKGAKNQKKLCAFAPLRQNQMTVNAKSPERYTMPRRSPARMLLLIILGLVISGCSGPLPLEAQPEHSCAESAYVELTNTGAQALRLEGWIFHDNDEKHTLPTVLLAPQASLRIWRGAGLDDATNLYLAHPKATWGLINNDSPSIERPAFWPWDSVQAFYFSCTVDLSR